MPKRTPSRYTRLQALIKNPEYQRDLKLLRGGPTASSGKDQGGRPIQTKGVMGHGRPKHSKGYSHRATSLFLDKYKLGLLVTPELFKMYPRSVWNKIAVFADDVNKVVKKPSPQQTVTGKTYGKKAALRSKPRRGLHGIGPAVLTPESKEKLWIDLDKKYKRRFMDETGRIAAGAPDRNTWKLKEYEKETGQKWDDPTAPSAIKDLDLVKLLKKAGLEINEEFRMKIVDAINMYLSTKEVLNEFPRASEVAAALMQLRDDANSFEMRLKELDFVSRSMLCAHSDRIDIERTRRQARMVANGCSVALKSLPVDKGGRPRDLGVNTLISEMVNIWKQERGTLPSIYWDRAASRFGGDFFSIILAILKKLDPKALHSDDALGQKIKAILKNARR